MSVQGIVEEAKALSLDEQKELIKLLVDLVAGPHQDAPPKKHSLRELRGLGKEIWEGIDVQEYIDQQREEWDSHP